MGTPRGAEESYQAHFFLKFKSIARADFFIEIWNEQFDAYEAHQTVSEISEDVVHAEESVATAATTTTADRSLEEIDGDTNFDKDEGALIEVYA